MSGRPPQAYRPKRLIDRANPSRWQRSRAVGYAPLLDVYQQMHACGNVGREMFDLRQ